MRRLVFFPLVLSAFCSLGVPGRAVALESELTTPYELNVVLHAESNRLLTREFRDRVRRELQDWLREALGDLAQVTVSDQHPRLRDVLDRGLQSMDGWRDRNQAKTHFVLVRFSEGVYEVEARQYDGLTGLVSPMRHAQTRRRDDVSKVAARLVNQDFGLVGTVASAPDDKGLVKVEIKAGKRGVRLERWLEKGQVFGLVPVQPDGAPGTRLRWTLLRVMELPVEGSGVCVCRLDSRYDNPLSERSVLGYRCLKLGTGKGPLRIRVVQEGPDDTTRQLSQNLGVEVSPTGFDDKDALQGQVTRARQGVFDTSAGQVKHEYSHVAFVTVQIKPNAAKVPVPIFEDQVVEIRVNASQDAGLLLTLERESWGRDVIRELREQAQLFQELQGLTAKPAGRAEALQRAQEGLKNVRSHLLKLTEMKTRFADKKAPDGSKRFDLSRDEVRLSKIKGGEAELVRFIAALEKIEEKANDPRRKKWLTQLEDGKLLEKNGDIEEAIALYNRMLADGFDLDGDSRKDLQTRADTLAKQWAPKNEAHRKARAFVKKWPQFSTEALKEHLEETRAAVAALREAGDVITLSKFLQGLVAHGERMRKENEPLQPRDNADDKAKAELIKELSAELLKLGKEVEQFLETQQAIEK